MGQFLSDTIIAPATVPGTGAITLIRVSGEEALSISDRIIETRSGKVSTSPGYSIKMGTIRQEDGSALDDVLVLVFHSPNSYTGEDSVEISCHASSYICEQILRLYCAQGARLAAPGEFTQRAFLNGKMDLSQAESVADVIAARSAASHRVAFNQLRGGVSRELSEMRSELLDAASLMELELDFSEEDVEFADREKLLGLLGRVRDHIQKLLSTFKLGNAIKTGIPVAIVGSANAGKSTLLNTLLQEDRAIVSDIAGTTRDTLEETVNIDGILFRFIDTAGLRSTGETIERMGIERTFKALEKADTVLALVDSTLPQEDILSQLDSLAGNISKDTSKVFLLFNKTDRIKAENPTNKNVIDINKFVSILDNKGISIEPIEISAKTGEGVDILRKKLAESKKNMLESTDETLITNARHYEALSRALGSIEKVQVGIEQHLPTELVAEDLRETLSYLEEVTDPISNWELLGNIFSKFCIGK